MSILRAAEQCSPNTIFSVFLQFGGGEEHYYIPDFNFQRAISPELLDLEPSFFYLNNSINLFYNTKKAGCIPPNRKHKVRLGEKTKGDTIKKILEGGHYYVGGDNSAARSTQVEPD